MKDYVLLITKMNYLKGEVVKQNYEKAAEYFEISGKYDNPELIFLFGIFYLKGDGVEKNYMKAKEYFEKSRNLGNSDALYYIISIICM